MGNTSNVNTYLKWTNNEEVNRGVILVDSFGVSTRLAVMEIIANAKQQQLQDVSEMLNELADTVLDGKEDPKVAYGMLRVISISQRWIKSITG